MNIYESTKLFVEKTVKTINWWKLYKYLYYSLKIEAPILSIEEMFSM